MQINILYTIKNEICLISIQCSKYLIDLHYNIVSYIMVNQFENMNISWDFHSRLPHTFVDQVEVYLTKINRVS